MYSIKNIYNIISTTLIIVYFIYIILNSPPKTYKNGLNTKKTSSIYNDYNWNINGIINKNNCYSYATDVLDFNDKKLQPGQLSGITNSLVYSCDNIMNRVNYDYDTYKTDCNSPCVEDYHKIFLAVDPKDLKDYHFYREEHPGYWSHKPGYNRTTSRDAVNRIIRDPRDANKDYTTIFDKILNNDDVLNYEVDCGCYCINTKNKHS